MPRSCPAWLGAMMPARSLAGSVADLTLRMEPARPQSCVRSETGSEKAGLHTSAVPIRAALPWHSVTAQSGLAKCIIAKPAVELLIPLWQRTQVSHGGLLQGGGAARVMPSLLARVV